MDHVRFKLVADHRSTVDWTDRPHHASPGREQGQGGAHAEGWAARMRRSASALLSSKMGADAEGEPAASSSQATSPRAPVGQSVHGPGRPDRETAGFWFWTACTDGAGSSSRTARRTPVRRWPRPARSLMSPRSPGVGEARQKWLPSLPPWTWTGARPGLPPCAHGQSQCASALAIHDLQ